MKTVKRTERGWVGHFICAGRCRFRRNTLLECGWQRVVISTVGAMEKWENDPRQGISGFEIVGYNRYYETMVFCAKKIGPYWDADVSKQLEFGSKWSIDFIGTSSDQAANDMHENIVDEFIQKLESGGKL